MKQHLMHLLEMVSATMKQTMNYAIMMLEIAVESLLIMSCVLIALVGVRPLQSYLLEKCDELACLIIIKVCLRAI